MLLRSWAHMAVQWQVVLFLGSKRCMFVSLSLKPRVHHHQFTRADGLFRCWRPQPGKLPGVDAKSGERLWEVKAPGAVFASPAIQGQTMHLAGMHRKFGICIIESSCLKPQSVISCEPKMINPLRFPKTSGRPGPPNSKFHGSCQVHRHHVRAIHSEVSGSCFLASNSGSEWTPNGIRWFSQLAGNPKNMVCIYYIIIILRYI